MVGDIVSKLELKQWLNDCHSGEFIDKRDAAAGLSSHLLRGRVGKRLTVAVGGDARSETAINALLDLLAWHWIERVGPADGVELLVGDGPNASKILGALRTLAATHAGRPNIDLYLVARVGGTLQRQEADVPVPTFESSSRATTWAGYLSGWWDARPAGLAADLVDAIGDARARLYPPLSKRVADGEWSLRIDGLQVGVVGSVRGRLGIGRAGAGRGAAVAAWTTIAGTGPQVVSAAPGDGELSVAAAAQLVRDLIAAFHGAAGGRLEHGQPDHALEATVLRGGLRVLVGGRALEPLISPFDPPGSPANSRVARGSQIPTQWWADGDPRYLDALLRDGRTAWAVEMKEPSRAGGHGRYLRHAIGQAVLYRHFLRTASPYGQWFNTAGLDQHGVRALVLYPQPDQVREAKISRRIGALWLLASAFDVQLVAVNTRPSGSPTTVTATGKVGRTVTTPQAQTFPDRARQRACDWKQHSPTLPDEARASAPYIRDGNPVGRYPYCLPPPLSAYNLLPEVRAQALQRFAADNIAWQAAIDGRPTNHLLSSQIQCVNALMPMANDPRLLVAAFGQVLPIGEPLPIEDRRYLTFEYIGAADHLAEAKPGIARERGRFCTSTDAAIRYHRPGGGIEIALIEWKYTESYKGRQLAKSRSDRLNRYRPLFDAPDGAAAHGRHPLRRPLRRAVLPADAPPTARPRDGALWRAGR